MLVGSRTVHVLRLFQATSVFFGGECGRMRSPGEKHDRSGLQYDGVARFRNFYDISTRSDQISRRLSSDSVGRGVIAFTRARNARKGNFNEIEVIYSNDDIL